MLGGVTFFVVRVTEIGHPCLADLMDGIKSARQGCPDLQVRNRGVLLDVRPWVNPVKQGRLDTGEGVQRALLVAQ